MEQDILLEGICAQVDEKIAEGSYLEAGLVLREYGLPETKEYENFTDRYAKISQQYHDQKKELLEKSKSLNLERLFWNSIVGGASGGLFKPVEYTAPAGALAGFSLTLYDELKNLKMDLSNLFWGVFAGGLAGTLAGGEKTGFVGAAIGGAVGIYKTIQDSREAREKNKKEVLEQVRRLDNDYQTKKRNLMDFTRLALQARKIDENSRILAQEFEDLEQLAEEEKEALEELMAAKRYTI